MQLQTVAFKKRNAYLRQGAVKWLPDKIQEAAKSLLPFLAFNLEMESKMHDKQKIVTKRIL
jgi:hypothetical protein